MTITKLMEVNFYKRQVILPFVKQAGQDKLKASRVLIIGAGGLGHPVAAYLAGSGIGHISILDYDKVDLTNLHRQFYFTPEEIGLYKAEVLKLKIQKQNPFIEVFAINEKLTSTNTKSFISKFDYILDCCDNLATKFLIHDTAFKLNKILIQGAIDQIEGEMKIFNFRDNKNDIPCLRCLWPSIPQNDCVGTCSEVGVLPSTAGVFGTLMASETIKTILNHHPLPNGTSFLFNLTSLDSRKIKWKKNSNCPLCSETKAEVHDSLILERSQIRNIKEYEIIDVSKKMLLPNDIQNTKKYLLVCTQGINSLKNTKLLREEGLSNIWSLAGGSSCL